MKRIKHIIKYERATAIELGIITGMTIVTFLVLLNLLGIIN
jgi:hypothetical protein